MSRRNRGAVREEDEQDNHSKTYGASHVAGASLHHAAAVAEEEDAAAPSPSLTPPVDAADAAAAAVAPAIGLACSLPSSPKRDSGEGRARRQCAQG